MRRDGEPSDDQGWVEKREGMSPGLIVALIVAAVLLIFILQNTNDTDVDFLFLDGTFSLWVVIFVSAVLGFLVGWFLGRSRMKRRQRGDG